MNWLLAYEIVYVMVVILVCLRIIYDTRSNIKTLAYLLLVIFLPFIGIAFYFSFGINYRKHKMYSKKLYRNSVLADKLTQAIFESSKEAFENSSPAVQSNKELAVLLLADSHSALTPGNAVKLLVNGEQKFPEVMQALENAREHIHIEYYIFDDDETGRDIEALLIKKAKEGVQVRFIYDDFGSRSVRRHMVKRLKQAGIQVFPFYRIIFLALANRLNYSNLPVGDQGFCMNKTFLV